MKENEDYLDDLLKTLGEEETSFSDNGGSFELSELMDNGQMGDEIIAGNSEEIKRPLSTLEQLMAEMENESEDSGEALFDSDNLFSEDSVGNLLESTKNTNDIFEDNVSYETTDDIDMSEIEALLNMSDNNEIVDEDEAFLKALNGMNQEIDDISEDSYPEVQGEVLELDPAELDALLSADNGEIGKNTDSDSDMEAEEIASGEGSILSAERKKKKKEKKDKKEGNGILKKLFSLLMEEYPEDEEPKEAGSLNLSEENKDILTQLDKEKGNKKSKKDKKGKKEKPGKGNKAQKSKKEKKPKKEKKSKQKIEKIPEKPIKKLPRKKVVVTFVFAFSILVAILLMEFIVPPMFSLSAARTSFDEGDYKSAYLEYYGKKLSEEDELKFQGATTVMRMQSNLDGYSNYLAINEEVMAIHSLLEGINVRTDIFMKAEAYGVTSEVNGVYNEILNILSSKYGISESDAIALTEIQSDVTYTKELEAIAGGSFESSTSVEEVIEEVIIEEIPEENLLPEELELLQGGE